MSGGGDDVTAEQDDNEDEENDENDVVLVVVCIGVWRDLREIGLKKGEGEVEGEGSKRLGFKEGRLERREVELKATAASIAGGGGDAAANERKIRGVR